MISGLWDIDRCILEKIEGLEDASLLNMLCLNKRYHDEVQQLCKKKLPKGLLIQYDKKNKQITKEKKKSETYYRFYIRNKYFLKKLKEKYDIDYIDAPSFKPDAMYRSSKILENVRRKAGLDFNIQDVKKSQFYLLRCHIENGDIDQIDQFVKNVGPNAIGVKQFMDTFILECAIEFNRFEIINKYHLSKENIRMIFERGDENRIRETFSSSCLPLNTLKDLYEAALEGAASWGNLELFNYIKEEYRIFFTNTEESMDSKVNILFNAVAHQHYDFFLVYLENNFNNEERPSLFLRLIIQYLERVVYISQKEANEILMYLIDKYLSCGYRYTKETLKKEIKDSQVIIVDPQLQIIISDL